MISEHQKQDINLRTLKRYSLQVDKAQRYHISFKNTIKNNEEMTKIPSWKQIN